jgi:hypothetical protein
MANSFEDSINDSLNAFFDQCMNVGIITERLPVSVSAVFSYSVPEMPTSATHTMIVDSDGNAHYNDYPDKERAPEIYG